MPEKLYDQDFESIRDQLLSTNALFEDEKFPANDTSIFFNNNPINQNRSYKWMRPDPAKRPQLFVDGSSRFDVKQGALGDCWMLAALANLTLHQDLFDRVVPRHQSFSEKYAGIFHFRFWQYDHWVDVVVDDRLPTYVDESGGLVFLRSSEGNEYWSALLEKAYAKLHGSYEALVNGWTSEGMQDFTGGLSEKIDITKDPPTFEYLLKINKFASFMACSIKGDANELEAKLPDGLVKRHAYSITKVQYVTVTADGSEDRVPLLRIRNPWGNDVEWNGEWSDNSEEWKRIPQEEQQDIALRFRADGEFWMSHNDFIAKFSHLEICYLSLESYMDETVPRNVNRHWQQNIFSGSWDKDVTAGGDMGSPKSVFHNNPQYIVKLQQSDEEGTEDECTLIVALMQKNRRAVRSGGRRILPIKVSLFHLPDDTSSLTTPLNGKHLNKENYVDPVSPTVVQFTREVVVRYHVTPGSYCVVPSTSDPNQVADFMLRVYSMTTPHIDPHEDTLGLGSVDDRILQLPMPGDENSAMKMSKLFFQAAGPDNEVNWEKLKQVLDSLTKLEKKSHGSSLTCGLGGKSSKKYHTSVSKDACRSMIALMDENKSGTLGFEEFKKLYEEIKKWQNVYKLYATDVTKGMRGFELRRALNSAGYRFDNSTYIMLVQRYSTQEGMITFDDFLMCAIKLKGEILK